MGRTVRGLDRAELVKRLSTLERAARNVGMALDATTDRATRVNLLWLRTSDRQRMAMVLDQLKALDD